MWNRILLNFNSVSDTVENTEFILWKIFDIGKLVVIVLINNKIIKFIHCHNEEKKKKI